MPNLVDQEPTGLYEVIKPPHNNKKAMKAIGAVMLAGVVGLGVLGGFELKDARKSRNTELAQADARDAQRIMELHKTGDHIKTQDGTILLMPGSKIRENMLQANPKFFGIVKGNVVKEVGDDEAVLMSQPMIRKEGAVWAEAVEFSPIDGKGYSHKSAEGLAHATIAVNLTGLQEKGNEKVLFCHGADDSSKYATISEDFAYVDETGKPTAFYHTMSSDDVEFLISSGQLVCEDK